MLIDWFTVGAQIVNFLVLVWLLKRFAYKPILSAIDAREKRIAAERDDAAAKNIAAQRAGEELQKRTIAFDAERAGLIAKAVSESQLERERLLALARKEAQDLRATEAATMTEERVRLGDHLMRLAAAEVFDAARKVLADLAAASLEERVIDIFTRRLRALDADSKESLRTALAQSPAPALVRSGFDLPARERESIQKAFDETFSAAIRLEFATSPAVICGIEVTTNGQKVAWSIDDYLTSLRSNMDTLLDAASTPPSGGSARISPASVIATPASPAAQSITRVSAPVAIAAST